MPFKTKIRHQYVEDIEFINENGERDPEAISERLGVKPAALARALYREGRPDLAAPFNALVGKARRQIKLCTPCKNGIHQAHRKYWHGKTLCRCGFCKTVTDNVRHK